MSHSDLPPLPSSALPELHEPFPLSDEEQNRPVYMGREFRFRFHGHAMEYFGIWIVNIVLTIVTLSLYAPWAKVRRLRYFYNNTEFFHRFFDFTGVPTKILVGRLVALGIWGLFAVGSSMEMTIAAFGGVLIYLAMPWLVRATIRFTARNSKFGNSRFYFEGTSGQAYKQFFIAALIIIFTLGLFTPVAIWLYKRYTIDYLYVGQLKFKLNADWPSYMRAVYVPILLFIAVLIAAAVLIVVALPVGSEFLMRYTTYLIMVVYGGGMLFIGPLIQARLFITTWNNTALNSSQFKTDAKQWQYAWIVTTNWIAKIISIGLLSAWAAIRLYRYQVESLSLHLQDDPNLMINIAQQDHSAIAEEISDIFDLDISL
ncbi:YjgN family protein [Acinetobacter lanii]|uniref:DUF898 domain-containing protein n=1 Tax=Acinetobacter lanii TaxID=2715163 RepID=A0A6G8S688_9GAMM|nr:DUF898 domain-containing protein [Acinetobacter lanii]